MCVCLVLFLLFTVFFFIPFVYSVAACSAVVIMAYIILFGMRELCMFFEIIFRCANSESGLRIFTSYEGAIFGFRKEICVWDFRSLVSSVDRHPFRPDLADVYDVCRTRY